MTRLIIPVTLIAATVLTACTAHRPDSSSATHPATASPGTTAGPGGRPRVEFVVSGTAPAGVDLTYHAGSHFSNGPAQINGNATRVPWQGSVAFSPAAKFYFISAQLYGPGSISCQIVVRLPGGRPVVVGSGHASGKFSTCSVEAAPTDPSGQHWRKV